ncbi:MAG TPA: DUF4142 domain-containing protein, partial [Polyangiaceae bacterium]|nr:DUF4142 domain-containing protein [Polyangiaceae bacterium]
GRAGGAFAGESNAGEGGTGGVAGEAGAGGETEVLNDAKVVKVLATVNAGEIAAAQVAQPAAQTVAVKNYAALMITDHSTASAQTLALVGTKHIAPQPSAISEHLEAQGAALLVTLSQTPQADFDKIYIQSQIAMHQEVLTLIDTRLLPDATDADLKALTATIRVTVATHLETARTIFTAL